MTKLEALNQLAAKVEAEECLDDTTPIGEISYEAQAYLMQAQNGSLDAAKALHEAVLPGWPYTIENVTGLTYRAWTDETRNLRRLGFSERGDNPARAWLLAILRALISQEENR